MTACTIAWNGLPDYARHIILQLEKKLGGTVAILSAHEAPTTIIFDERLNRNVTWLNSKESMSWEVLQLDIPKVFIHTGWAYTAFNALAKETTNAGGQVYSMVDNRFRGDLRQYIGKLLFKRKVAERVNGIIVPGKSGQQLMEFFGYPKENVYPGLYCADTSIFSAGKALTERPKDILFVGQLIDRKGLAFLYKVWNTFQAQYPDWNLVVAGAGPLVPPKTLLNVRFLGKLDQKSAAEHMKAARALILPSIDENWGVVVHEAAASGCALLLSNAVAASEDLILKSDDRLSNGIIFPHSNETALLKALVDFAGWDESRLDFAYKKSLLNSSEFGAFRWDQLLRNNKLIS